MRRLCLISLLLLAACGDRSGKTLDDPVFPLPATTVPTTVPAVSTLPPEPAGPFTVFASWVDGSEIPERHTCVGDGISPALSWSGVPVGTVELALVVVDLDDGASTNWVVVGVGAAETGMAEGRLPPTGFEWVNASGSTAWVPPCPPSGTSHRYEFALYALNQQLEPADNAPATDVIELLDAITIARSFVTGVASTS